MTLEEALKQPFDEYMAWCRNFVTDLVAKDPAVKYVIEVGEPGGMNVLEAGWARRYWFNRVDAYHELHDGLSDMIEGGRLRREHIPNDYRWLVETLAALCN